MDHLNFIWPGPPGAQAVGDLPVAKSALFIAVNGFISPSYLRHCPCDGLCFREDVEQRYYQLANFVTAMFGLALVLGQMVFSATLFRSEIVEAVARWLVSLTKVSMVGTLQFGLYVFYFCLKVLYARSLLVLHNFAVRLV